MIPWWIGATLFLLGGCVAFLVLALCKVSGRADIELEIARLQMENEALTRHSNELLKELEKLKLVLTEVLIQQPKTGHA